jgi:hypothetical protein
MLQSGIRAYKSSLVAYDSENLCRKCLVCLIVQRRELSRYRVVLELPVELNNLKNGQIYMKANFRKYCTAKQMKNAENLMEKFYLSTFSSSCTPS